MIVWEITSVLVGYKNKYKIMTYVMSRGAVLTATWSHLRRPPDTK